MDENKKELILDTLRKTNKELKSQEIAELTGLDKKEVTKLLSKLKKDGEIISPKRCFYKIKQ